MKLNTFCQYFTLSPFLVDFCEISLQEELSVTNSILTLGAEHIIDPKRMILMTK